MKYNLVNGLSLCESENFPLPFLLVKKGKYLNLELEIISWNQPAAELFQLERNEKEYFTLNDILAPIHDEVLKLGTTQSFFAPFVKFSAADFLVKIDSFTIDNDFLGILCYESDRYLIEVHKNEELRSGALTLAHDLKAPARNITNLVDMILERNLDFPYKDLKVLEHLKESSGRLMQMISDILEEGIIDKDNWSIINLNSLLQQVLVQLKLENKSFGKVQLGDEIHPKFKGDYQSIYSIFYNLISNSFKYRKSNEAVKINIRTVIKARSIKIIYEDNGIGIEEKYVKHIFKKFYRGPFKNSDQIEGNGLGMYNCKTILESLGGAISVSSSYGVGTKFSISLPRLY